MKPRPFSNTDTDEVRSKVIFESKIDHRYVKSLVKIRSTVPNDDGHIIVCEEEGQPTGIIFVQLKKIPKGARTYQCEAELFVIERVTIAPFILLCVDVDNEKVFWKHLLPDQIEPGKKSQVIKFTDQDEIDSKKEYIKKWIELVKEYSIRASSVSKGLPIAKTNESATGIEVDASLVASEKKELENYKFKSKIDEAKILTDNNQYENAKKIYVELLAEFEKDPKTPLLAHFKVNNNLGICYLNLGNEDKAIAHFKIGYEKKSPNSDLACRNRALASLLEERPLEGLPFIEEALEIKPNSIQNINMKVSLLRAAGRDDDALGLYLEGGDSNAN